MDRSLTAYEDIVGVPVIEQLRQIGDRLRGVRVVHVNSTMEGGGVAEILRWMVPLMQDLGLDAHWKVIKGRNDFFSITKSIHNGLQGNSVVLTKKDWDTYVEVNMQNLGTLKEVLEEAEIVVIHDPQPAPLLQLCPHRRGKWIWRIHVDVNRPFRPVWKTLRTFGEKYDASIFSIPQFAQFLPHPQFIIAPSIDPLSEKNMDLDQEEIEKVREEFKLDPERPIIVQISRFDRFKDPVGVIQAYRLVRKVIPVQLILAGGGATDDPEGHAFLEEVMEAVEGDPDIHVLSLPPDAHKTINALQRLADVVIQKSTREGFGLTVTEGLWKGKPVIGGDVGGIKLQVVNHYTGFLVNTPEGAAHRIRFLFHHRERMEEMGKMAKEYVRQNFLLTRLLRDYLLLILCLIRNTREHRIIV
jgi:trehalose synthase